MTRHVFPLLALLAQLTSASAALHPLPPALLPASAADPILSPPHELLVTSSAFPGIRPAKEGAGSRSLATLPGGVMQGEVVYVGRGCIGDIYLANPASKIALIERGHCTFREKLQRALAAGAAGVIVHNQVGDFVITMGIGEPPIDLPGVFIGRNTGLDLRGAVPPVTARVEKPGLEYLFGYLDAALHTLRDAAVISNGQLTSMLNRLEFAARQLERGNTAGAISALTMLKSQVQTLLDAGTLHPDDAAVLLQAVQDALNILS